MNTKDNTKDANYSNLTNNDKSNNNTTTNNPNNALKYFVCPNVYCAYDLWIDTLKKSGFQFNNPNHIIVVCGNFWGQIRVKTVDKPLHRKNSTPLYKSKPMKCINFAQKMYEQNRFIYIRGEQEYLWFESIEALKTRNLKSFSKFRFSGFVTNITMLDIIKYLNFKDLIKNVYRTYYSKHPDQFYYYELPTPNKEDDFYYSSWYDFVKEIVSPIVDWIEQVSVNYFEINNLIFTSSGLPWEYNSKDHTYKAYKNWNTLSDKYWGTTNYYDISDLIEVVYCNHVLDNCDFNPTDKILYIGDLDTKVLRSTKSEHCKTFLEQSWFAYIEERKKLPSEPFFSAEENIVAFNSGTENSIAEDSVKINCVVVTKK